MLIKMIVLIMMFLIAVSLARAGFALVTTRGKSNATVKALTLRIALSVALFILLLVAFATGLIQPHGIV